MTIDISAFWGVVRKKFWTLSFIVILFAGLAVAGSFMVQKKYASSCKLYVTGKQMSDIMTQSMPLLGLMGGSGGMSADYIVAILESEDFSWGIIEKLELAGNRAFMKKDLPEAPEKREQVLRKFRKSTEIKKKFSGEIDISVKTGNAELSANIANEMVAELMKRLNNQETEKVDTFERLMTKIQGQVEDLENKLIQMQVENEDLLVMDAQTSSMINSMADINAQKMLSEIRIEQLETLLEKPGSFDMAAQLNKELLASKAELGEYSKFMEDYQEKLRNLPPTMQKFLRLKKEHVFNEELYTMIQSRLHSLIINMELGDTEIEVLDRAQPKYRKVDPNRPKFLVLGLIFGLMVCFIYLLFGCKEEFIIRDSQKAVDARDDSPDF